MWLLRQFQAEDYFLQTWLRQHGDVVWITKEKKWPPDALVNWSPIIRWFVTLLKCTPTSSAHLPPMHTCLQCTPASSVHLPPVHIYLQIHACLHYICASRAHPVHTWLKIIPASTHACLQQDTNKFWDCSADLASSEWGRDESHDRLTHWQVDSKPASTSSWPSIPRCWPSYSSWSLGNVSVCGLSLKLLFHYYF